MAQIMWVGNVRNDDLNRHRNLGRRWTDRVAKEAEDVCRDYKACAARREAKK